jgi:hypothetical protein
LGGGGGEAVRDFPRIVCGWAVYYHYAII